MTFSITLITKILLAAIKKMQTSLQLSFMGKNRVANHFEIEKKAIKRNKITNYFRIKQ